MWWKQSSCYLLTPDTTEADAGAAEAGSSALLKSIEGLDQR